MSIASRSTGSVRLTIDSIAGTTAQKLTAGSPDPRKLRYDGLKDLQVGSEQQAWGKDEE
jgi:hypothetical protein